jgi:hypothetical protein
MRSSQVAADRPNCFPKSSVNTSAFRQRRRQSARSNEFAEPAAGSLKALGEQAIIPED